MTKKSDAPAIRFKGFSDAWEQREVGDLLIERSQQAPMSDEYPLMAFIANEGVAPKGERYDRSALVTDTVNKLYKKTEKGDFIYSSNNLETGSIGLNKYGKACISPVYSIFEPTGIADSDFLGRRLVRKDFINAMVKWRQGVIYGQWRIHESDFLKIEISVPSVEEQRKIGAYLDQLDNLITLHQRKFEKLTNVKKSMLEKMFPQNGSSYPEIRFKGFTDPWEQRKLGELFEESDERASDREILSVSVANGIYPASESDRETNPGASLANYKIVHFGDVVYNSMRMWQGAVDASRYDGIVSPAYVVARPNSEVYARFFARLLRQPMLLKQYQQVSQGNSKDTQVLKFDDFASIGISMPASENEQRRIGGFFDRLDSLITLHQRKLELLQNIKKSLLDKMFV